MIVELQSSKKKHKRDGKHSDDRKRNGDRDFGAGDLVLTEGEVKKKKRKERKEEREGAIDGALSFSLVLQRLTRMHCMCIQL